MYLSITIVEVSSLLLGAVALLLALHAQDFLELLLLSGSLYMPIVTVPLLLAIFGFRSSTKAALIGIVAGFITVVVWRTYFAYTGLDSIVPGMLANFCFFMGSHYLLREEGGWKGIGEPAPLLAEKEEGLVLGGASSGIALACTVLHIYAGSIPSIGGGNSFPFTMIYGVLLFSSCLIALIRFRQAKLRLGEQNTYLCSTIKELRDQLIETLGYHRNSY